MKKTILFSLVCMFWFGASAQIEKGMILLEGGVNLGGNPAFVATNSISISSNGYYSKNYVDGTSRQVSARNYFSYSIAPRIGYSIFRNFATGTDFQYYRSRNKSKNYDHSTNRDRSTLCGIFARYYFGTGKLLPFVESGLGLGWSKSNDDDSSPGGALYQDIERRRLFYFSGSTGVSYAVNSRFRMNLQAKAQRTIEKPIETVDYHTGTTKIVDFDSTIVLSFSYLLNK